MCPLYISDMCTYSKPYIYRSMNFIMFLMSYDWNSKNQYRKINTYFVSRFMHFELGLCPGMMSFSLTSSLIILRYIAFIKFVKKISQTNFSMSFSSSLLSLGQNNSSPDYNIYITKQLSVYDVLLCFHKPSTYILTVDCIPAKQPLFFCHKCLIFPYYLHLHLCVANLWHITLYIQQLKVIAILIALEVQWEAFQCLDVTRSVRLWWFLFRFGEFSGCFTS
jgi:hypothetical protein